MKIWHLPIEPYETRYTADWIQQFEDEFSKNNVEYETILGKTNSTKVTDGGVLDACGTHLFKFSQLVNLINRINAGDVHDRDVIFFSDLWFPGIESLFYIRAMLGIKFKICGILHAGTYDSADFTYRTGMRPWGEYLERSWLTEIDKIFVATQFHKTLILNGLKDVDTFADNKIVVTGLPFYAKKLREKYPVVRKENIVVFPHRLDPEKHPEKFDALVERLNKMAPELNITAIRTIESTKSRDEYFSLLAKSKVMVSFADQETFGYSTLESMALGNIVFVPNRLSYTETVPDGFRYNDDEPAMLAVKVINAIANYNEPVYDMNRWQFAIRHMIAECEEVSNV